MAAPYLQLSEKVETAFKAIIDALALTVGSINYECNTSLTQSDRDVDFIYVVAQMGEEIEPGLANWRCEVTVNILTNMDSPDHGKTWHNSAVGAVADKLNENDIASQLSSQVTDFHVEECLFVGQGPDLEERMWVTSLNYELVVCGVDIT